jgi:hypothetical protein
MARPGLLEAYQSLSPTPATLTEAATLLNQQTTTITVSVPISSVAEFFMIEGILMNIIEWGANPPSGASNEAVVAAKQLGFLLQNPSIIPSINMGNSQVNSLVSGWVNSLVNPGSGVTGVITSGQAAGLLGFSVQTVPVWNPPVSYANLQEALGLL